MHKQTLKLRSGDSLSISLANELVDNGTDPDPGAFGYHSPMDTNLHTHGLHDEPGRWAGGGGGGAWAWLVPAVLA